ncbi:hypothetical protein [Natronobacterium texcoconense]|uniref:Uncharacterized protein n=1 Tax=Natronobacterium texcoconense TaxID=1095778 RepID=A0A1H0ZGT4_NATTX|nr:hypothetical protein [Natronobacterium texcoconense]SDQ26341.1 hypothetical protein SAMN04489842_0270 [Natronobacterium texcoconense]
MSAEDIQSGEREDEIKRTMYILIIWTIGVVLAGILLVLFSDVFASIFT